MPLLSDETAEQAFVEIANKLVLQKRQENEDIRDLIHLSEENCDRRYSEYRLALAYVVIGRLDDATKILERVVRFDREILDEKHQARLNQKNILQSPTLKLDESRKQLILENVDSFWEEILDKNAYTRVISDTWLGTAYILDGRLQEEISALEQVLLPGGRHWTRGTQIECQQNTGLRRHMRLKMGRGKGSQILISTGCIRQIGSNCHPKY